MKKYTKKEKQAYYKGLRNRWSEAKKLAEKNEYLASYEEAKKLGTELSYTSFILIKKQLVENGLEGTPYIDTKTFKGWKESGFQVKKGQKSIIKGITWLASANDDDDDNVQVFPKVYSLFHTAQVEKI